jgi:hypothetical protein
MRELTVGERTTLERRKAAFDVFFRESMPVLAEFVELLGLPDPCLVINEPDRFLPPVAEWVDRQEVSNDDRDWIAARLGYFIGYVLAARLGGHWMVVEDPDSPLFARYVVGGFVAPRNPLAIADPFAMAIAYLECAPPRNLVNLIWENEARLKRL